MLIEIALGYLEDVCQTGENCVQLMKEQQSTDLAFQSFTHRAINQ
jgi:hypothetical protein